jgi:hypothetical protein
MNIQWAKHLLGCFERGVRDCKSGKVLESCPYVGRLGVNRQRAEYWKEGFHSQKEGTAFTDRNSLREVI